MENKAEFYFQQADQELTFFRSLKSEMNVLTTRKIVRIVRVVLSSVAKNLSTKQISEVAIKLPYTLRMIFMNCWSPDHSQKSTIHLDELVEDVCNEKLKKGVLCTNEVDALKYILIVIKNLKIVFDKIGVSIFPYSIISEYEQAVKEGAV
ncbi:MAG TPA: DUF2267 domain-containing protein [Chryseolinea sp.]|nr:DUF2267 domain-containing protein [Chryseolinea sp.]HPM31432.1 DUF2267 domain-containing protein [Chryseolinea sp.]